MHIVGLHTPLTIFLVALQAKASYRKRAMNKLSASDRMKILRLLCEGMSIRAIVLPARRGRDGHRADP